VCRKRSQSQFCSVSHCKSSLFSQIRMVVRTSSYLDYDEVNAEVPLADQALTRRHGGYGHHGSGYGQGHSGYGFDKKIECCPLVVDPLTFVALLGGIFFGSFFLNVAITMNIDGARRIRRSQGKTSQETKHVWLGDFLREGERMNFASRGSLVFFNKSPRETSSASLLILSQYNSGICQRRIMTRNDPRWRTTRTPTATFALPLLKSRACINARACAVLPNLPSSRSALYASVSGGCGDGGGLLAPDERARFPSGGRSETFGC